MLGFEKTCLSMYINAEGATIVACYLTKRYDHSHNLDPIVSTTAKYDETQHAQKLTSCSVIGSKMHGDMPTFGTQPLSH